MAVATKEATVSSNGVNAPSPYVHTIIRNIVGTGAFPNQSANQVTVDEVDAYLDEWHKRGYVLHSTHYLGTTSDQSMLFSYIMVKTG